MKTIITELEQRLKEDRRELKTIRKRLTAANCGRIRVRDNHGYTMYYSSECDGIDGKRAEKYISVKDHEQLSLHANALYDRLIEPVLIKEIAQLESFLRGFKPEQKYSVMDQIPEPLRKYVDAICRDGLQKAADWAEEPYLKNSFPVSPSSAYESRKGDIVRSRAECLAVNVLYDLYLPYRYECGLELDDRRCIFPDITIMHPDTAEIWYVEIFGMMADPDYAREAFDKIRRFQRAGLGGRLLAFFDYPDVPFDPASFEKTIRAVFLPDQKEFNERRFT